MIVNANLIYRLMAILLSNSQTKSASWFAFWFAWCRPRGKHKTGECRLCLWGALTQWFSTGVPIGLIRTSGCREKMSWRGLPSAYNKNRASKLWVAFGKLMTIYKHHHQQRRRDIEGWEPTSFFLVITISVWEEHFEWCDLRRPGVDDIFLVLSFPNLTLKLL